MEGETGLINVVVSVGHSVSQPANAGGETFLVLKTLLSPVGWYRCFA